jgi:hypothetical protein
MITAAMLLLVNSTELKLLTPLAIAFPLAILLTLAASQRGRARRALGPHPRGRGARGGNRRPGPRHGRAELCARPLRVAAAAIVRGASGTAKAPVAA